MVIDKEVRILRRINALDFSLLVVALLCLLGFGMAKAGHAGVNNVLKGETKLAIDVYIVGLKSTDQNLFKVGDHSAITIRNQPVQPPMLITNVKRLPRQIAFLLPNSKRPITFLDPTQFFANDYLVTVEDQADVTNDGYVVRGNKVKVGNLIDLEGFKYRVQGVVVDIRALAN